MEEKIPIIVLEPCTEQVKEFLRVLEESGQIERHPLNSLQEAGQVAQQLSPCMLFYSVIDPIQAPALQSFLKKSEKLIKSGVMKTVVISQQKNRRLATELSNLGVTDYLEEPFPSRTLQFKVNLQLKAIHTLKKQIAAKNEKFERKIGATVEKASGESPAERKVKSLPAVSAGEDIFLFRKSKPVKVGTRFTFELEGPSPDSGAWKQAPSGPDKKSVWRWVPKVPAEATTSPEEANDGWCHEGDEPVFQESQGKWKFASEKPHLYLQKKGAVAAEKLSVDADGTIHQAEETEEAAQLLAMTRADEQAKRRAKALGTNRETEKAERPRLVKEGESAQAEAEAAPREELERKEANQNPLTKLESKEGEQETEATEARRAALQRKSPVNAEKTSAAEVEAEEEKKRAELAPLEKEETHREKAARLTKAVKERTAKTPQLLAPEEKERGAPTPLRLLKNEPEKSTPEKITPEGSGPALRQMREVPEPSALPEEEKNGAAPKVNPTSEEEIDVRAPLGKLGKEETPRTKEGLFLAKEKTKKRVAETNPFKVALKEKRAKVFAEMAEQAKKPLPEKLPLELEAAIRKKFGLENRPEITPRELSKKVRLEKFAKLKEKLAALDKEIAAVSDPTFENHTGGVTERENTQSQKGNLGRAPLTGIRSAQDSLEEAEDDEGKKRAALKLVKKSAKAGKQSEENFLFLAEEALDPPGGAWESTEGHYVYLSATDRYRGQTEIAGFLPLWIYEGEARPELTADGWRFRERLPKKCEQLEAVPFPVRDFLQALLKKLKREAAEANPEKAPHLYEHEKVENQKPVERDGLEEAREEAKEKDPGFTELEKTESKRRSEEKETPLLRKMNEEDALLSPEEPTAEASAAADILASPDQNSKSADFTAEKTGSPQLTTETAGPDTATKKKDFVTAPTETSNLKAVVDQASPALAKFLEKRKTKAQAAEANKPTEAKDSALGDLVKTRNSLVVSLAASDAVNLVRKSPLKAAEKVLRAVEILFPHCLVALFHPLNEMGVSFLLHSLHPKFKAGLALLPQSNERILFVPVTQSDGQPLGYLHLQAGAEKTLSPEDLRLAEESAKTLGIFLTAIAAHPEIKKAA